MALLKKNVIKKSFRLKVWCEVNRFEIASGDVDEADNRLLYCCQIINEDERTSDIQ